MQGVVLKELTDFSDLRKKQEYNTSSSKQSSAVGMDLDMQNNEMIMKSFRQLRQKLKGAQRQNTSLRQEMKILQVENMQLHQSQNNLRGINHQLKQKNMQITGINDQLKKKINIMKDSIAQKSLLEEQMEFMKQNLMQLQMSCQNYEEEKKKLIQISIQQKFNLQEKINKLLFKGNSDDKYIEEIEKEMSKAKQANLKLENQVKKMQIKYDEEMFNKKWSKDNFQKEKYLEDIKSLQNQLSQTKNKNKKQKEKRSQLERRVIQLEQIAGLWNVKAEAYQSEAGIMNKKVKKMEKRVSVAKNSANKMANQRICYQQKFFRSLNISQELINRVKRQLIGDMVQLAKSCQYRLNKLRDDDYRVSVGKQMNYTAKKWQSSNKKNRKSAEKHSTVTKQSQNLVIHSQTQNKQTLRQIHGENQSAQRQCQRKVHTQYKMANDIIDKQNSQTLSKEYSNLELKIRKQREQMEKKLKERMLYRKIQVCNQVQKGKFRQDYLKLIFQK